MASSSSCFFTTWKMFSIGFKSGDLAGILCCVHSILSRADKGYFAVLAGAIVHDKNALPSSPWTSFSEA
jgi:hypothetical protein